ncbi:hypothetical protein Hanom_Chr17g01549071 [Helianthus anomalus]
MHRRGREVKRVWGSPAVSLRVSPSSVFRCVYLLSLKERWEVGMVKETPCSCTHSKSKTRYGFERCVLRKVSQNSRAY